MKSLDSIIKIADLHAKRICFAMDYIQKKMPISDKDIENLSNEDLPMFELYASRFSKLQDFMGTSLFPALLEAKGESTEQMTFIDKLHKLEKFGLISSAEDWMSMRQLRNSLAHEYPEHPELAAKFFNEAYQYGAPLLETLEKVKKFISKDKTL